MRHAVIALCLTSVLAACDTSARVSRVDSLPPAAAAPPASGPPADTAWRVVPWRPFEFEAMDRGSGIIGLADRSSGPRVDSLVFRAAPDPSAPVVGLFLMRTVAADAPEDPSDSSWHYAIAGRGLRIANALEFEYELSGVPTDSATADGRWVRALLGTDTTGSQWVTGWADARRDGIERREWADQLSEDGRALFFRVDSTAAISATPDGPGEPLARESSYVVYATDTVQGRWLRVRVVTPSDYCEPRDSLTTERMGWVEYLDARSRPRMWYFSRGC